MKLTTINTYGHWLPLITRCPERKLWLDLGYIKVKTNHFIEIFSLRRKIYKAMFKKDYIENILTTICYDINIPLTLTYTQILGKVSVKLKLEGA
jgi:hypothetical protein